MKKIIGKAAFVLSLSIVLIFTASGCSQKPQPESFTVTVAGGTGGGAFAKDADCTVTAVVADGKFFTEWTAAGQSVSKLNPYTFKVTKDIELTANFKNLYTVTVAGGKINGQASAVIKEGESVTAVADTLGGKRFTGWYDGNTLLSANAGYTFTPAGSCSITARFTNTFTVTVVNGRINGMTTAVVDENSNVTVVFDAGESKVFDGWKIGDTTVSTAAEYTFAVTADVTVTAAYHITLITPKNDANQMFNKKPSGYSDMIVEVDRQKDGDNRVTVFTEGADYAIFYLYTSSAANKENSVGQFKMVQTIKGANAIISTMDGAHSINIGSTPGDYFFDRVNNAVFYAFIEAAVGQSYDRFQSYYVAAQVKGIEGSVYRDSGISEIGTSAIRQAEGVNITVIGGTGSGTYEKNTSCTVTATVGEGYYLVKWTVDGAEVSTDNPYTFTAAQDTVITAVTAPIPEEKFTVTVEGGTGGGEFTAGEHCTVTPTVPEGKGFIGWTVSGVQVSASASYTFTVTADITVTAVFGNLVALDTPENGSNQMFNYLGYGDGRNTTEFDRQKDGEGKSKTAFTQGADYILYYVYTSQTADKAADQIATFKLVKDATGGKIMTMDGALSIGCGTEPGNYYIDNSPKATYFAFFEAVIGGSFDQNQKYYFAAQVIAVADSIYTDSGISQIGGSYILYNR